MTFLEKAKQDHNISNEDHTIQDLCPSDLGYETKIKCKAIIGADEKDKAYICRRCWEREMPGIEPKEDISIVDQVMNAYNDGLNDAWELAKKVVRSPKWVENAKIFINPNIVGIECESLLIQFFELTPQEALAKLKVYEDSKIEVGDVVVLDNEEYVITRVDKTSPTITISVLNAKGEAICWSDNDYTKTGKHIDIQSLLEQIGGQV